MKVGIEGAEGETLSCADEIKSILGKKSGKKDSGDIFLFLLINY